MTTRANANVIRVLYCPTCQRTLALVNLPIVENIKMRKGMAATGHKIMGLPQLSFIFVPFTCSSLLHTSKKIIEPESEEELEQTEAYRYMEKVAYGLGAASELAVMDGIANVFTFPRAFVDVYRHKMKCVDLEMIEVGNLDQYAYADFF
jgi:hypothetical protein